MPQPFTDPALATPRPRRRFETARRRAFCATVALLAAILAFPAFAYTVVEYYNATLDHYFMTPLPVEISAL
ncbi:MAG: hypothetical protein KGL70_10845, partial [Betaproteobacteria bacterium]|nr:hypothetical protein [Betaproteobacteria bacterium]